MTNPPESVPASAVPAAPDPAKPQPDPPAPPPEAASDPTAAGETTDASTAAAPPTAAGPVVPAGVLALAPSFGLPPTQPAPPTYDPTLLMQTMPVSAVYVPAPAPVPASQAGWRTAVTVLSMLLGLFVLASGTLGVLYVRQGQESTRKSEEIVEVMAENAQMERELNAAQRDLRGVDADLADIKTERDAIAACLIAIYDWWDALEESEGAETPQTEAVWLEASRLCRDANQYL